MLQLFIKYLSNLGYRAAAAINAFIDSKGQANGLAPLDADGKIPINFLNPIALTDVAVVEDETAQLALTAQEGDVCVRTDESKSYIHNGGTSGTMTDWTELKSPTGVALVTSVDGRTGAVSLADIYAAAGHNHNLANLTEKSYNSLTDKPTLGTMAAEAAANYVKKDGSVAFTGVIAGLQFYNPTVDNGASGASKTIDFNAGTYQKITIDQNTTLSFSNNAAGKKLILDILWNGNYTLTWPATVRWEAGTEPTWTKASGKVDVVAFLDNGTHQRGQVYGKNYANT